MTDTEKMAFIRRSEQSMRTHLLSKTWPEKIRSIERMRAADKIAKQAMREALQREKSRN